MVYRAGDIVELKSEEECRAIWGYELEAYQGGEAAETFQLIDRSFFKFWSARSSRTNSKVLLDIRMAKPVNTTKEEI